MRHSRIHIGLLLLGVLAVAGCSSKATIPNRSFEGKITEVIRFPGIGTLMSGKHDSDETGMSAIAGAAANVSLTMYVRENKVAFEMAMLGGLIHTRSVIDRTTRTITILLPNKVAMVSDLRGLDSAREKVDDSLTNHPSIMDSLLKAMPQPTGKKETINGMEAEEYKGKSGGVEMHLWLTSDPRMKFFDVVRDAILGRARSGGSGMEQVFSILRPVSAGKVPVKFDTKWNGDLMMDGELKTIEEGPVDDKYFEIPKDYRIENGDSLRKEMHHKLKDSKSDADEDDDDES